MQNISATIMNNNFGLYQPRTQAQAQQRQNNNFPLQNNNINSNLNDGNSTTTVKEQQQQHDNNFNFIPQHRASQIQQQHEQALCLHHQRERLNHLIELIGNQSRKLQCLKLLRGLVQQQKNVNRQLMSEIHQLRDEITHKEQKLHEAKSKLDSIEKQLEQKSSSFYSSTSPSSDEFQSDIESHSQNFIINNSVSTKTGAGDSTKTKLFQNVKSNALNSSDQDDDATLTDTQDSDLDSCGDSDNLHKLTHHMSLIELNDLIHDCKDGIEYRSGKKNDGENFQDFENQQLHNKTTLLSESSDSCESKTTSCKIPARQTVELNDSKNENSVKCDLKTYDQSDQHNIHAKQEYSIENIAEFDESKSRETDKIEYRGIDCVDRANFAHMPNKTSENNLIESDNTEIKNNHVRTILSVHDNQYNKENHCLNQVLNSSNTCVTKPNLTGIYSLDTSKNSSLDLENDIDKIEESVTKLFVKSDQEEKSNDLIIDIKSNLRKDKSDLDTKLKIKSTENSAKNIELKEKEKSGGIVRRVSFDPLALLLDAALEGELELVKRTSREVADISASNDEGLTALHNAVVAGHYEIVKYLVEQGCDVNGQDGDGWTPLHCAASCNNLMLTQFLVEHGASVFATTQVDDDTPANKCKEEDNGYGECHKYLSYIQDHLGQVNNGRVYALFDYEAQRSDELSFCEGDELQILHNNDVHEQEWWWARHISSQRSNQKLEGFVPRNLLGLYPRVMNDQGQRLLLSPKKTRLQQQHVQQNQNVTNSPSNAESVKPVDSASNFLLNHSLD